MCKAADQWSAIQWRRDAAPIVGATYGRLTERDQMEAAKGRPYDGTPLASPARGRCRRRLRR